MKARTNLQATFIIFFLFSYAFCYFIFIYLAQNRSSFRVTGPMILNISSVSGFLDKWVQELRI